MKLSVVLPAYNEAGNITELIERLVKVFEENKVDYEINCVVQGTDGTKDEVAKIQEQNKRVRMRAYRIGIGVGPAHRIGFGMVSPDSTHVLSMDCDLNHQPEELPRFLQAIKTSDITIGSRYVQGGVFENMPLWKRKLSASVNSFLRLLFNLSVKDKTSGYRLVKKEVVDSVLPYLRYRNFEYYPEFLLRAKAFGYTMSEVPITFKWRVRGESKMNLTRSFLGYAKLSLSRFF